MPRTFRAHPYPASCAPKVGAAAAVCAIVAAQQSDDETLPQRRRLSTRDFIRVLRDNDLLSFTLASEFTNDDALDRISLVGLQEDIAEYNALPGVAQLAVVFHVSLDYLDERKRSPFADITYDIVVDRNDALDDQGVQELVQLFEPYLTGLVDLDATLARLDDCMHEAEQMKNSGN